MLGRGQVAGVDDAGAGECHRAVVPVPFGLPGTDRGQEIVDHALVTRRWSDPGCVLPVLGEHAEVRCRLARYADPPQLRTAVGPVHPELDEVLGLAVGGPAGFEEQGHATLEPEERGGEVLHLEGGIRCLLPVVTATAAPGPELRVGGRRDREDPRLPQQVECQVQDVDADVHEESTTCQVTAGEPAAEGRDAGSPQPGSLHVVGAPESAVADDALEGRDVPAAPVVERDVEHAPRAPCGVDHRLSLVTVPGDRLLAQHVETLLQGGDGDGRVEERGNGDADGVEPVQRQQVLPAGDGVRDAVLGLQLREERRFHSGQAEDLDVLAVRVRLEVLAAGPADPHHRHPQAAPVGRSVLVLRVGH